mgnify:FL=1
MNYLFYNPSARNGKAAEDLQLIKKTLDGQDVEIYAVTDIDDYVSVIDKIQPEDIVYIVGGDGTLNRFINDSTNLRILGDIFFYSAGTGNDFKHDVDPDNSLYRIRLNDYIRNLPTVTVGGVTYKFVNGIGFGIDGYCCEEGDRQRAAGRQDINYSAIAVKGCLFRFKPYGADITVDGETRHYDKVWLAPTMFGKYYGGGMKVAPEQDRNNLQHTVTNVVIHGTGRLKTLIRFAKIFSGEHTKYTDMVDIRTGHEVRVVFDRPCALQIDGETVKNVTEYTVRYE